METRYFDSLTSCCASLADFITAASLAAVQASGIFSFVLTGGRSPKTLYEMLAAAPSADKIPWPDTHLFWGDDRFLPPDHPDSNYALAEKSLISRIAIPAANIHPMPATADSALAGAEIYEQDICRYFGVDQPPELNGDVAFPGFDLMLLGMGPDGHIASLFPGHDTLNSRRIVTAETRASGTPPVPRITLTLPMINRSRDVVFLISGEEKRNILQTILTDPDLAQTLYPAALVTARDRLIWFVAP